jgi:hypothetical protein
MTMCNLVLFKLQSPKLISDLELCNTCNFTTFQKNVFIAPSYFIPPKFMMYSYFQTFLCIGYVL